MLLLSNLKNASSLSTVTNGSVLCISFTTIESTLGGGINTDLGTVNTLLVSV